MSLENICMAIKVVVAKSHAHAAHLLAVTAYRQTTRQRLFPKGAVVVIHEEETRRGVARDKDIWPTVLVHVKCNSGHAIGRGDGIDARLCRYICERAIAVVTV